MRSTAIFGVVGVSDSRSIGQMVRHRSAFVDGSQGV